MILHFIKLHTDYIVGYLGVFLTMFLSEEIRIIGAVLGVVLTFYGIQNLRLKNKHEKLKIKQLEQQLKKEQDELLKKGKLPYSYD